jgi:hypothetical protein
MLRLSRLALVVVVNLWSLSEGNGDELSALVRDGHLFVDHRFVFVVSSDALLPKQLADLVSAHGISIVPRRIDLDALRTSIMGAYVELGAQG